MKKPTDIIADKIAHKILKGKKYIYFTYDELWEEIIKARKAENMTPEERSGTSKLFNYLIRK